MLWGVCYGIGYGVLDFGVLEMLKIWQLVDYALSLWCKRKGERQKGSPPGSLFADNRRAIFKTINNKDMKTTATAQTELTHAGHCLKDVKKTISRKEAALCLTQLYNSYEVKPLSARTIYKKIFMRNGCWHLIGYAHNYSL